MFCVDEKTAIAAFNTKTGEVLGQTAQRHTSAEFVAFLTDIVVNQPHGKQIHVIADNLSAHKTNRVDEFLAIVEPNRLRLAPPCIPFRSMRILYFRERECIGTETTLYPNDGFSVLALSDRRAIQIQLEPGLQHE